MKEIFRKDGRAVITSDHGNIEEMINLKTGEVDTEHSANPVPLIIAGNDFKNRRRKNLRKGILSDVTPTILDIMDVKIPKTMTRDSLLKK